MRAALPALALLGCADPLARCTAPATRKLDRLDAAMIESETALARGYRLVGPAQPGPVVGFCAERDNFALCGSRDLSPPPRPFLVEPAAERARLEALRARQEIVRGQVAALSRSCVAPRR